MGFRPTIIKEYKCEYGETLSGYNYGFHEFSEFLDKIGVCYWESDNDDKHEIRVRDLLRIEKDLSKLDLKENELSNLKDLIDVAKHSNYTKKYDCVKIEWF